MGIRDKIKRRLPIVGAGGNARNARAAAPSPAPAAYRPPPPPPAPENPRGDSDVKTFLGEFVTENKLVLFMKGSPMNPMCGFSANAAGILQSYGKPLAHFDVLSDPDVRTGIKEFSQWPTIPQIYIGGEFVGGSDILMQMHQAGELKEMLEEAFTE